MGPTWVSCDAGKVFQTLGQCCAEANRRELVARAAESEDSEEAWKQASVTLWSLALAQYKSNFDAKEGSVLPVMTLAIDSRMQKAGGGTSSGNWASGGEEGAQASLDKARDAQDVAKEAQSLLNLAAIKASAWAASQSKSSELRPLGDLLQKGLTIFEKEKDYSGEAVASNMLANFYILMGQAKDAVRMAKQGLAAARQGGQGRVQEIPLLHTLMAASFLRNDPDEALRISTEVAQICRDSKASAVCGLADACTAQVHLANDEQGQAQRLAEAALKAVQDAKDTDSEILVLGTLQEIAFAIGKPVSALKAAQELLERERRRGIKEAIARAQLLVSISDTTAASSSDLARQAKEQFASMKDKVGEGLALVSLARALFSSAKTGEATGAAKEAMASFEASDLPAGQGFAGCFLALVEGREDPVAAERLAREALCAFQDARHRVGQALAELLIRRSQQLREKPSECKIVVDDFAVAHVEISGVCTPKSLEQVLNALHEARCKDGVKAVVLLIQGAKGPVNPAGPGFGGWVSPQKQAVASGTFLLGLRTLGLPCVAACCGKIAGPAWGLVLATDYRIASATSNFILPIWGPPECFGDLVGHTVAMQLCYNQGPVNALTMLEYGVIHQCQRGDEDTKKAATEVARRIASTPTLACHQATTMLSPAIEKYASIVARGGLRA
ncbi:unnamed protein product [Symbiodinium pilosum]|uniref:Uncharacterized protein n=1 Tax=Symbiodinium pilosum TaxID=2952 RepID=A0A812MIG2_SYMPI|nr:unnamed protein product [Symbiodinium pilosum]